MPKETQKLFSTAREEEFSQSAKILPIITYHANFASISPECKQHHYPMGTKNRTEY